MKAKMKEILIAVKNGSKSIEEAQNELMSLLDLRIRRDDTDFRRNVCLSYRHDFGLLPEPIKRSIMFEYSEWMRAIVTNLPYSQ
jgi:hypothetical protein